MSGVVFWGLTNKDIGNVLWNGVTYLAVGYAGQAVGAIANLAAEKIFLPNDPKDEFYDMKFWTCIVLGAGAGFAASVFIAHRLPFVEIAGETALKSLVIGLATSAVGQKLSSYSIGILEPDPSNFLASQSNQILGRVPAILGNVPMMGAWGYFGPWILYMPALINSICGSIFSNAYYKDPSSFF